MPRAPSCGVSGHCPSLASLCSADLRLLTAERCGVDARAAPGIVLLCRKGSPKSLLGATLGTGTKLRGAGCVPIGRPGCIWPRTQGSEAQSGVATPGGGGVAVLRSC